MLETLKLPYGADVEFVVSQGEFGFRKVLADFTNASNIYILTYSMSTMLADEIIEALRGLDESVQVRIVTNIPPKKTRTLKDINRYTNYINPSRFGKNTSVFYSFRNHAKVIATNNLMYVGSANYSNPGLLECGCLVRGAHAIQELLSLVFGEAMRGAKPHLGTLKQIRSLWTDGFARSHRVQLETLRSRLETILSRVHWPGELRMSPAVDVTDELDDVESVIDSLCISEDDENYHVWKNLDLPTSSMKRVLVLLEASGVREFLAHDRDKFVEDYVADDPGIDVDATQQDGFFYEGQHEEELFRAAESELMELREESQNVLDGLDRAFGVVDRFEAPPSEADAGS